MKRKTARLLLVTFARYPLSETRGVVPARKESLSRELSKSATQLRPVRGTRHGKRSVLASCCKTLQRNKIRRYRNRPKRPSVAACEGIASGNTIAILLLESQGGSIASFRVRNDPAMR
jgi:hypothetical protein